jgi:hypothetical protein
MCAVMKTMLALFLILPAMLGSKASCPQAQHRAVSAAAAMADEQLLAVQVL